MYKFDDEDFNIAPYDDLLSIYQNSFADNFSLPAITDYVSRKTLTYGDFARRIARLHLFFELAGINPGDKIALLGKNTPTWVVTFMATVTYGAVIVPILHDFNPIDAQNIVNHSDAVLLFVSDSVMQHLNYDEMPQVRAVISLDTNEVTAEHGPFPGATKKLKNHASILRNLTRRFHKLHPGGFSAKDIKYKHFSNDSLAVINYTSGTTGYSKGVMLSLDNLRGNVVFGIRSRLHYQGSRVLSFLPLAHAYGCAFDMLTPLAVGTHITIFGKLPTPALLVKALGEVQPSLIICVPLILEKIYRKMIVPMITSKTMRWVLAVPMLDKAVYSLIRSKLVKAFGGSFEEIIVGGAPLNPEVEDFLHRIKFPFTVGYGMTECGPLISYRPWRSFTPTSSGRCLKGIMEVKISTNEDAPISDRTTSQGEICVRGLNVMKGYYKNPEATEAVLDSDGWLHTGDMGSVGSDNRTIFIRGRYKTMILSANGQNIYPEEIEAKLSNMPYVSECLVLSRNGHIVAIVHADKEAVEADGLSSEELLEAMHTNRSELNKLVAPYEQIDSIELIDSEFEKTPKRSIKRYLYK